MVARGPRRKGYAPGLSSKSGMPCRSSAVYSARSTMPSGVRLFRESGSRPFSSARASFWNDSRALGFASRVMSATLSHANDALQGAARRARQDVRATRRFGRFTEAGHEHEQARTVRNVDSARIAITTHGSEPFGIQRTQRDARRERPQI